jgi:hypothetical protein
VMLGKGHAFSREIPERRGIALGDEVGPHAVPNDHDNVAIVRRRCFFRTQSRRAR